MNKGKGLIYDKDGTLVGIKKGSSEREKKVWEFAQNYRKRVEEAIKNNKRVEK